MKPTQRNALGRGLGALLPAAGRSERPGGNFLECPLDRIDLPETQPRRHFDDERLQELAISIREKGLIQPLVVRREGERYRLIAGERRLRAARLAGLATLPVVVKDVAPEETFELALVENIQREDLNPIEEAEAYARLVEIRSYSQQQLAERVGKDRSTVANALRLLQLDEDARRHVADGSLSPGHARALLAVADPEARAALLAAVLEEGLSVRETERRARQLKEDPAPRPRRPRVRPLSPLHRIVEEEMAARLTARVEVKPRSRRSGKIVIHYDDLETLARIHRAVTGEGPETE